MLAVTAFDANSRKTSETDQTGKTTHFEYDANGQLTAVVDALGQRTQFAYDEAGNKIRQIDALGRITRWTYDLEGHPITRSLPLGMVERLAYNQLGQLVEKTDFNGQTIRYAYDENGRLVQTNHPDGQTIRTSYTEKGVRDTVTDQRGVTRYSYDLQGRLVYVDNPNGSFLAYSYDEAGNRTMVETPNTSTHYEYDDLNRLERVIAPEGTTTYQYDAVGNRASIHNANSTTASYQYDALYRLIYLENATSDGNVLSSYAYTLDPTGNRIAVDENTGRRVTYTYDDLHRLTQEAIADPVHGNDTISYSYDAVGNRLTKTDNSGTVVSTYDDNDRLQDAGDDHYYYDPNGNTVESVVDGVRTTYTFDYENRLVEATTENGLALYEYDSDGIRVSSSLNGEKTNYLVDKNRPYAQVLEETEDGVLSVQYSYGDDLLTQNRNDSVSYYLYDGHGSTVGLADSSEALTDSYLYDAFGNLLAQTGDTPNDYLYTGEQFDPNLKFYYLRARYYNQSIGRFHSMDSWMGNNYDPVTLHKYLYTNANPVNRIDPSGKFSFEEASAAFQVAFVLAATPVATFNFLHPAIVGFNRFGTEKVTWTGRITVITAGLIPAEAGKIWLDLETSNWSDKKEISAKYEIPVFGLSWSGSFVDYSTTSITITCNRLFNEKLQKAEHAGLVTYNSASVGAGIGGATFGFMYIGKSGVSHHPFSGLDVSFEVFDVDMVVGVSILKVN